MIIFVPVPTPYNDTIRLDTAHILTILEENNNEENVTSYLILPIPTANPMERDM